MAGRARRGWKLGPWRKALKRREEAEEEWEEKGERGRRTAAKPAALGACLCAHEERTVFAPPPPLLFEPGRGAAAGLKDW